MSVNPDVHAQNSNSHSPSPLGMDGQARNFALQNKIPPELHKAIGSLIGHKNGFENMSIADRTAALNGVAHMAEMQNLLTEQGESPANVNFAIKNHMAQDGNDLSMSDVAILLNGHSNGLSENEEAGELTLDRNFAAERKAELTNNYVKGLINSQENGGAPVSTEDVHDFAKANNIPAENVFKALAENNVEFKQSNGLMPEAAKPAAGLVNTGMNVGLMTNTLNFGLT
ncbi:MAG: hypothetical protein IT559_03020 [Alphaproteobacteria bacterium]|nr:hypothetical protein [Alphaproteobacteria bacterium]